MMRTLPILLLAAAAVVGPAASGLAQTAAPAPAPTSAAAYDAAVGREAVAALATRLEEDFLFPDKGAAYAAMLRANLASGKYDGSASEAAFAKAVTADLQAVFPDRHLAVHVVPPEDRRGPGAEGQGGGLPGPPPEVNTITKSGWLADGVAYISFDAFFGTEATLAALKTFIAEHRGAKSLIIDIRGHRGGGLAEMDVLFPEIFAEPTTLVAMDTRSSVVERMGGTPVGDARVRRVTGPAGVVREEHYVEPAKDGAFQKSAVYLLTSKRSASAAEHLAMALKGTHRAVLIGETTYGAGNFGGMMPLDKGMTYAAFVPFGRTFDPRTGEGWEGKGVAPDVAVPADQALDEALRRAGVNPAAAAKL